ncbi:hypothetical protein B5S32_g5730 [[Candida] boidinii]|nr:hypothetical protein B5S32_g5730 [[Candida] boidinii]
MQMDAELLKDLKELNLITKEIKKEDTSLTNRFQSIILDSQYVDNVSSLFPHYPIIPNERCGLWYVPLDKYTHTSYFKSTDGHINNWDFSTRRLNFHLLSLFQFNNEHHDNNGIIIVDSTRRGKKIPDAQSKTIPIWCSVINCILYGTNEQGDDSYTDENEFELNKKYWLWLPRDTITKSEYLRILKEIPNFIYKVKELGIINESNIKNFKIKLNHKKLKPYWIYPDLKNIKNYKNLIIENSIKNDFNPIILCTSSYQCQDGMDKRNGFTYVQGAADDHELWSNGLEPIEFWSNFDQFKDKNLTDDKILKVIKNIKLNGNSIKNNSTNIISNDITKITDLIHVGKLNDCFKLNKEQNIIKKDFLLNKYNNVIIFDSNLYKFNNLIEISNLKILNLDSNSKKSSKEFRTKLNDLIPFYNNKLKINENLLILCNNGSDLSIGLVLILLCLNYNLDWNQDINEKDHYINKIFIRKNLIKIIQYRNVNPSRATLNSVNHYLMSKI